MRERVLAAIERIAKGLRDGRWNSARASCRLSACRKIKFTPATYNNPELTKRLVAVWKKSLGDDNVEIVDPTMGGEDFSEFSLPDHSIPAVDFHFGAVDPAKIAEYKRREKIAELAFEQIRTRSRADDPDRHHRNDERRARIDEEVETVAT